MKKYGIDFSNKFSFTMGSLVNILYAETEITFEVDINNLLKLF